jgi:hypothetical protein
MSSIWLDIVSLLKELKILLRRGYYKHLAPSGAKANDSIFGKLSGSVNLLNADHNFGMDHPSRFIIRPHRN